MTGPNNVQTYGCDGEGLFLRYFFFFLANKQKINFPNQLFLFKLSDDLVYQLSNVMQHCVPLDALL